MWRRARVLVKNRMRWAAVAAVSVLAISGCTGESGDSGDDSNVKKGGELRVGLGEPRSLLPQNTTESEGSQVLHGLFAGLVDYDAKTYKVQNVMAESITSSDSKLWTIKIKSGWKFSNGEAVNADAYLRAWNAMAYGPNGFEDSFVSRVKGHDDIAKKEPSGKTMSGLKKVSDTEFTVELTDPFAGFPLLLGYQTFYPMAEACEKDFKACGEAPIGNGPFKMDGTWQHNQQIKLVKNSDYKGTAANVDSVVFKIYDKIDTQYNDFLAGNLDVIRTTPPAKVPEAKAKYPNSFIEDVSPSFTYMGFPLYSPAFKNKKIRQALSMAIDRQAIIDAVFQGRFTPAKSYSPPNFPGGADNTCKYCELNPDKAKATLAEGGGWPAGQKLELWFNAGAGHEVWVQAVGDQIKKNLGIDYVLKGNLQFAQYLETADAKGFTGPFRLGWSPDYPLSENYLTPLYGTNGSSNNSTYANPEFDAKLASGDQAKTLDEAIKIYQQAEAIVGEDMPVIPMWFGRFSCLYAETLTGAVYGGISQFDVAKVAFKK